MTIKTTNVNSKKDLSLEKIAEKELPRDDLSLHQRIARNVGGTLASAGGTLAPVILGSTYSVRALTGGRRTSSTDWLTGKVKTHPSNIDAKKMDRVARKHNYERVHLTDDTPYEVIERWRNPKNGKTINLSVHHDPLVNIGPHFQAGKTSYGDYIYDLNTRPWKAWKDMWNNAGKDGIIRLGDTTKLRGTPTIAHEFGHALQGKKMIRMNLAGRPAAMLGAAGVIGSNSLGAVADPETVDKVQKGFAAAGTLGGLGLVASEAHASWLGSKGLRKNVRLRSFAGLPSYLGLAAAPAAAYYANKKWRDVVTSEKTASAMAGTNYYLAPQSHTLANLDTSFEKVAIRRGKINADIAKYLVDKTPLDLGEHIERAETIADRIRVPNPNTSKSAINKLYKTINKLRNSGDA